jgi:hypothetical protein
LAYKKLDEADFAAYGWKSDLSNDEKEFIDELEKWGCLKMSEVACKIPAPPNDQVHQLLL